MEKFSELTEPLRIVIFCGGFGTRMWPMSRLSYPKQFQPLLGDKSFFRESIERVRLTFKPEDIFVAVSREHVDWVEKQAKEIPKENIIVEPERRDTLGAVAYSTAYIDKKYPSSLMAIIWGADHLVREKERFNRLLRSAAGVCQDNEVICKVDVKPDSPTTALGWIKIGKEIGRIAGCRVFEFKKHIEKPNLETAEKMFKKGGYLINTGYFVGRTSVILSLLKKYNPECFSHIAKIKEAIGTKEAKEVLLKEYPQIEKTSFDYGFFEKVPAGSMYEIPSELGWYDVGTWDLLYEALAVGERQNITKGDIYIAESHGNIVYLPNGKIAAVINVNNLVIIDTKDGLLVCQRGNSKEVKKFVEYLKEKEKKEYL